MKINKIKWIGLGLAAMLALTGCQKLPEVGTAEITPAEWQLILESSQKTSLNLYTDLNSTVALNWLKSNMVPHMETKLGVKIHIITLNYAELRDKLKNEKINEVTTGSADLLVMSKSGFKQLKDQGLLYGPFSNKLPNAAMNQAADSYENANFDGTTTDNMAVALGKNQLVLFYDEDKMEIPPQSLSEFKAYINSNPGKVALPSLDTQEGQAFVQTLAASLCDQKKLYEKSLKPAEMNAIFAPVANFLKEVKPNLYQQGQTPPASANEMDKLFKGGQISFSMSMDQNRAVTMTKEEKMPDGAKATVLSSGTTGMVYYGIIPFNSANKSGAMAVLNEWLSGEMQGDKYDSKNWGDLPSVDPMRMEKTESEKITKIVVKRSGLKEADLSAARLPQIPNDKAYQLIVYLKSLGYK